MGVKGLWNLLAPFCDKKPLFEIGGETVAVDLSGWVCDSQSVTDNHAQPKLYLRNLYFRTSYLLLYDVIPVFVLEGQAPEMKRKVMEARKQLQYQKTAKPGKTSGDISRRRFKGILDQCEKLLLSMGLQCVVGKGEAEALCAHLNAKGLVSGVISQDSDCFVYGATRLYRNFSVGNGGAGSVDIYDLNRVRQSMDLGRNKMVALALLCGSDYNGTGVDGVGITSAVSFLKLHSDSDIISRLISWTCDVEKYKEWERIVDDPLTCTNCGHGGPLRTHSRQGCATCSTHKGCNGGEYKDWRLGMKIELQIRNKALAGMEAFPDPALLKEFLHHEEVTPPNLNPSWNKPDLIMFTKMMTKLLGWSECYCLEKFLPLMTRWQLLNPHDTMLQPKAIVKKRNPRGVACYQVLWSDPKGLFDGLITDDQLAADEINIEDLWTTVEKQNLFQDAYPEMVREFEEFKVKKKKEKADGKKKKTKQKSEGNGESINDDEYGKSKRGKKRKAVGDISLKTKSYDIKKKINRISKKAKGSQKTLHSFLGRSAATDKSSVMSPLLCKKMHLFEDEANRTVDLLKNLSLNLDDDIKENDLSNIIKDIITRNDFVNFDIETWSERNTNSYSTPKEKSGNVFNNNKRISYFFGDLNEDNYDAFENSIDLKNAPDEDFDVSASVSKFNLKDKHSLKANNKCNLFDITNADSNYVNNFCDIAFNKRVCDVDRSLDKPVIVPTLEERLFGCNDSVTMVTSTPDKANKNTSRYDGSSCSIQYTPLAERIRRLKGNL